jgi:hypothetical protein
MNKTIEALKQDIASSQRIKEKLLSNITTKNQTEIVLNLVELDFDFKDKTVELIYYVIDKNYPNTKLDFAEFENIISNA